MNSEFSLDSRVENNKLVITSHGYINNHGGEKISAEASKHIEGGIKTVIIDLNDSKVINSIGISLLIEIIEKLNQVNGKLIFINMDPTVEKTFTIMGLFKFASKADSLEEATK